MTQQCVIYFEIVFHTFVTIFLCEVLLESTQISIRWAISSKQIQIRRILQLLSEFTSLTKKDLLKTK